MPNTDAPTLIELIGNKEFEEVFQKLEQEETRQIVDESIFDIVLSCCAPLGEVDLEPQARRQYEALLVKLISFANPKEVLMAIVEELDSFKENVFFYSILEPIKTVLLKIKLKKEKYYDWILNLLYSYIRSTKKESVNSSEDPLLKITSTFVEFLSALVENFLNTKEFEPFETYNNEILKEKQVLIKCLINILHYPLAYYSFEEKDRSVPLLQCTEKIIKVLTQLESNIVNILCNPNIGKISNDSPNDEANETVPVGVYLGLGNLCYLIFCEGALSIPTMFSHQYLLEICFSYLISLISHQESIPLHKGLLISSHLIEHLRPNSLSKDSLDEINYNVFPKHLFKILKGCTDEKMRASARIIVCNFLYLFESSARFELFLSLWHCEQHSGIRSLLLVIFKSNLITALKKEHLDSVFVTKLEHVLELIIQLPDIEDFDILEHKDHMSETLNLLIFLFQFPNSPLRQADKNLGKLIKSYLSFIKQEASYLKAMNSKYKEDALKKHCNQEIVDSISFHYAQYDLLESRVVRALEVSFF